MTTSGPSPAHGRPRSEVLDAILDAVSDATPEESGSEPHAFRDKAFAQVDIPGQIDNLLPITTPRLWIALVGMLVLLLAGGVYAAGTPQVTSIVTNGRAVAASGVMNIESASDMSVVRIVAAEGIDVREGDLLATGSSATGQTVQLKSPSDGTVWQILASPGQALTVGEPLMTLLPPGGHDTVLIPVEEEAASRIRTGQKATVSGAGIESDGVVTDVSATPLRGDRAAELTALSLDPQSSYLLVSVTTSESLPAGAEVTVEIVESESTLLNELASFR